MAYQDIVTIAAVSFHALWGDKERNLSRIEGYMRAAARRGADMVVLPEMALTSYDVEPDVPAGERMQARLAEPVDGPSATSLAAYAQELGIYAFVGMPTIDDGVLHNSLLAFTPEGLGAVYHKMHLPHPEPLWAARGEGPSVLETPWGPVGLGICYDSYRFPELPRYYAAKGCRIYVNSTAHALCHGSGLHDKALQVTAIREGMFVVTANLCGKDVTNWFDGSASILGPSQRTSDAHYYAGGPFTAPDACEEGMVLATVDLALADRSLFCENPEVGAPDWRPDRYRLMLDDVLADGEAGW